MKINQPWLFTLLFLGFFVSLDARHIIGGDMAYQCLGGGAYRFTMKVYRDCQGGGAGFDSAPGNQRGTVTVFRGDSPFPFIDTYFLEAPQVIGIDPQAGNPCVDVPPNVCVQQGTYTFTLNLPISTETYYVVYQRCCRNNTISNIYNPGATGSTYMVEINEFAQNTCNNSPRFENFPPAVICAGEQLIFDHSATDAEGDQLVYELCSPLQGGTQNNPSPNPDAPPPYQDVNFILPTYSPGNPVGGNPRVSIDANGLITGTPITQGQFVVGICVSEFRNGQLLSRVQRDFQFNVTRCEPRVDADLDGVDAGETIVYDLCGETTVDFINESTDVAYIDEYLWQFNLPNQPLAEFNTRDVTFTFPGPGQFTGIMVLNPGTQCTDTAEIVVNISPEFEPDFIFDYDTCVAGPVDYFDATPQQPGLVIENWNWDFGDGNTSTDVNPVHEYQEPGNYPVTLVLTDTLGCVGDFTQEVTWFPVPPVIIIEPSRFVGCPLDNIAFINLSTPIDDTYDIRWDFGDNRPDSILSPIHYWEEPGLYSLFIEITSPIGCYTSQEFVDWIDIDSFPVADFEWMPLNEVSNFQPTVQFQETSRHAVEWEWNLDEFRNTIGPSPVFTFPDTGLMEVELIATHEYGCSDTIVKVVDVEPQITYYLPNAFTPNGDGKNEEFKARGYFRGLRNFHMKILNRWGGVVFETNDPEQGWNGRLNNVGRFLQTGVYSYAIQFTGPRGQSHYYQGFTTLIH